MRASIIGVRRSPKLWGLTLGALLALTGCKERTAAPPVLSKGERTWVPLSGLPLRGPATARLTLLFFCDFQSPYCASAAENVAALRREYGDALRIQFRHNTLPYYPNSQLASEASAAAAEQGQFWRYHDVLYAHQDALDRASLERYARELGLDLARFGQFIDAEQARLKVDADNILSAQVGVRGGPVFYVNGRDLRGPVDRATLKKFLDEELAVADATLASGVAPKDLYQRLAQAPGMSQEPESIPAAPPAPGPRAPSPQDPDPLYKVEVADAPSKGPSDARVTIVLWSDFECARCGTFESTLNALAAAYPKDVRIVWKFRPVPDHLGAVLASEAALAAGAQGRFWQMRDKLFAHPEFERPKMEEHARQLGLDMRRFQEALEERTYSTQVARDLDVAEELGIGNLPTLFINGRRMEYGGGGRYDASAALSPEVLRARVEEELRRTAPILKQGVAASRLYDTLTASGQRYGPPVGELPPLPKGVYQVEAGTSPVRGPAGAPVTLVLFSDFQCPYCYRVEKTLDRVREQYGDKVRIVWKDSPNLEIHTDAMTAHEAARAAGEQGRFWEMHDKIFSRPFGIHRAMLDRYAAELGLDMDRYRAALETGKFRAAIHQDISYGISLAGQGGTPAVFINGRLLPGAFPFETFREVLDAEFERLDAASAAAPADQSL
jgi:protein-disulfide isomerase